MKKRILVCLLVVIAALSCMLVACDHTSGTTKCEHIYTEDWKYDETGHWKECTICHEKDANGVLKHYLDSQGQCNRCDYRKSSDTGVNVREGNILYTEQSDGTYKMVKLFDTSVKSVEVPATVNGKAVTAIADGAFLVDYTNQVVNKNIEHITLPEGLLEIGSLAFWGSENLQNVTIPSTVTKIGRAVFKECTSITEVIIPDAVTNLDTDEFCHDCTNLERVIIGDAALSLDNQCFRGCSKLTEVVFNPNIVSIGQFAFYECTSLKSINIPDTVTSIGGGAFRGCSMLASVNFGANSQLTAIGESTFQDCVSLTSVTLPANVVTIDQTSYANCKGLTSFKFNDKLEVIGAGALYGCENVEELTIPASVKAIHWGAFYNLKKITKLVVPDSVTDLGIYFLHGCTSLRELTIPFLGATMQYRRNLGYFFDDDVTNDKSAINKTEVESNRDNVPASLKSVTITHATGISDFAFASCENLETVNIPDSILYVGQGAFRDCKSLNFTKESDAWYVGGETNKHLILAQSASKDITSCRINEDTKIIAGSAFAECTALTEIIIPDDNKLISVGNAAFGEVGSELNLNYTTKDNVQYLGSNANPYLIAAKSLKGDVAATYIIDEATVVIAGGAFASCIALTEMDLQRNVNLLSIGASAFSACRALESIEIPDNVISIESRAFNGCGALKEVKLSKNLLAADTEIFNNCSSIEKASIPAAAAFCMMSTKGSLIELNFISGDVIPDGAFTSFAFLEKVHFDDYTIKTIGDGAFAYCTAITSINLPEGLEKIGESAFQRLASYTGEIIIPDSVTDIGDAAFDFSNQITKVVIGKGLKNIGYRAFSYIYPLTMEVDEENPYFSGVDGCIIEKATKTLVAGGVNANVPSDGSVEVIGDWAFSGRWIQEINIDVSVKRIGEGAFTFSILSRINYNGTKAQWRAMYRHPSWYNDGASSCTVSCTDGYLDAFAD